MSWKLRSTAPPHLGIGLDSKIFSASRRKSRIHCGSSFMSEIWRTISTSSPLRALKNAFDSVRKSYLLISPIGSAWVSRVVMSVAMVYRNVECRKSNVERKSKPEKPDSDQSFVIRVLAFFIPSSFEFRHSAFHFTRAPALPSPSSPGSQRPHLDRPCESGHNPGYAIPQPEQCRRFRRSARRALRE